MPGELIWNGQIYFNKHIFSFLVNTMREGEIDKGRAIGNRWAKRLAMAH
jgi:hypothetical protein